MNIITSIQNRIYEMRGERVMLDFDLADLYEVPTKALNQAVKRNIKRFPKDFMFRLTLAEWQNIRSQIVTGYGTSHSLRSQNVTASEESFMLQVLGDKRKRLSKERHAPQLPTTNHKPINDHHGNTYPPSSRSAGKKMDALFV